MHLTVTGPIGYTPPRDRLAVYCRELSHAFLGSIRIKLTLAMNSPYQKKLLVPSKISGSGSLPVKPSNKKIFRKIFIAPKDSPFNFRGSPQVSFWNNK